MNIALIALAGLRLLAGSRGRRAALQPPCIDRKR